MSDKENKGFEENIGELEEKIRRSKQDIPESEKVFRMEAPDPWPDPPQVDKKKDGKNRES
jgi:hypothetical protein